MKKTISALLEKPMDRKSFLQHAGVGVAMMFGGSLVAQALTNGTRRKSERVAYGTNAYGGIKRG